MVIQSGRRPSGVGTKLVPESRKPIAARTQRLTPPELSCIGKFHVQLRLLRNGIVGQHAFLLSLRKTRGEHRRNGNSRFRDRDFAPAAAWTIGLRSEVVVAPVVIP